MARHKRGGFIFVTWIGDHSPRHVHVYRDGRMIVKWDLENQREMEGRITSQILDLINELIAEGKL